jgi:hypothetical protein
MTDSTRAAAATHLDVRLHYLRRLHEEAVYLREGFPMDDRDWLALEARFEVIERTPLAFVVVQELEDVIDEMERRANFT